MLSLLNARTGQVVASTVEVAATRASRRRGLLGRDGLQASTALMLSPCFAVHTAFMRFAIDVVFVNQTGSVVRIVRSLSPWRAAACASAHTTIEFAAGALRSEEIIVGDRLYFASVDVAADGALTSTFSFDVEASLRTA